MRIMQTLVRHSYPGAAANAAIVAVAAFVAAAAMTSTSVLASELTETASHTIQKTWEVDMRGKPPYKRKRVDALETVDIATRETGGIETAVVWERDTRGKPPYTRRRAEIPVVDTASMEIVAPSTKTTDFRGRPPFKRHR